MAKQENEDVSRPAEAAHPYYSWTRCLEVADAVYHAGGDRADVSKAILAHALQMSEDSAALSQQISSAKTFRMIEGRGTYRLTDAGQRYFLPTTESESRLAELSFLTAPKAFATLVERFDGNTLPSTTVLANILLKSGSVPRSWKDRVAGIFMDGLQQLRIIDASGRLRYQVAIQAASRPSYSHPENNSRSALHSPSTSESVNAVVTKGSASEKCEPESKSLLLPNVNEWVFTEAGGTVRVETPSPLPRALWERLTRYVEMLEPALPEKGGDHEGNEKRGGE